jgi:DNA repair ATPase RecN
MFFCTNHIHRKLTENPTIITSLGMDVKNYPIEIQALQALQAQKIALHIQSTHFITLFPHFSLFSLDRYCKKEQQKCLCKEKECVLFKFGSHE